MKRLIIGGLFVLLICQSFVQEKPTQIDKLYGKWKHLESSEKMWGSNGAKWVITSKDTSKYVEFYKDGKMSGTYFESSKYKLKDSATIIINFESNNKAIEYRFWFNDQTLVLNNAACDEGCSETFIKVKY